MRALRAAPVYPPPLDPAWSHREQWFPASKLVRRDAGGPTRPARDEVALARARVFSAEATAMGVGGVRGRRAAELHLHAAETKRLGGGAVEAYRDYEALARYYLDGRHVGTAIAYLRKAMHVADLDGRPEVRGAIRLLAADAYLIAREQKLARKIGQEARAILADAGDIPGMELADEKLRDVDGFRRTAPGCGCGSGERFDDCCKAFDVPPVEYSAEILGAFGDLAPPPYGEGLDWIDTLMRPPPGCEGTTWYAWRIEAGCHRLDSHVDWSGRALGHARTMAAMAKEDGDRTAEASSAVLQSCVALEAFLTAWKSNMRRLAEDGRAAVIDKPTAAEISADGSDTVDEWDRTAGRMFPGWVMPGREAVEVLFELRNRIVHGMGKFETVIPAPGPGRTRVPKKNNRGKEVDLVALLGRMTIEDRPLVFGPSPAPWCDRLLTADVAAWAVAVVEGQVKAVRDAYRAEVEASPERERMEGAMSDAIHEAELEARCVDAHGQSTDDVPVVEPVPKEGLLRIFPSLPPIRAARSAGA